jgi:hypothetical protein
MIKTFRTPELCASCEASLANIFEQASISTTRRRNVVDRSSLCLRFDCGEGAKAARSRLLVIAVFAVASYQNVFFHGTIKGSKVCCVD